MTTDIDMTARAVSPRGTPHRIVVVGTGTGVGKTFFSVEALTILSDGGHRCLGLKPVETGYVEPQRSDAAALSRAARHPLLSPLRTSPRAESPHRAFRGQEPRLSAEAVSEWVEVHSRTFNPTAVLVETAGGLFTPLSDTLVNLDLVRALEPCTFVLVAADRLGVLHDVLSTVTAARAVHRAPDLICTNLHDAVWLELENARELRRLAGMPTVIQGPLLRFMERDEVTRLLTASE